MNRAFFAFCLLLGLCTVFSSPLVARGWLHPRLYRQQHQQPIPPTAEPVSLHGTVKSISATHIEVTVDEPKDADKKKAKNKKMPHGTWSVILDHDTPIQVTGEATPDYLHHGLLVQLSVAGKERELGTAEMVHEMTIVTAALHKPVAKSPTSSKPVDNASLEPLKQESGRTIIGQLGHYKDNQWSVISEGKTRHIELADDAKIKVAFTGSKFVSPGDKIVVQGEMVHGKPGTCTANSVQVTLAIPLTGSKNPQPKNDKKA